MMCVVVVGSTDIYDNYLGFVVSTEQTRVVVKDNTILSYVARLAYHLTIIKGTEL